MASSEKGRITLPAILQNLETLKTFIVEHAELAGLDPKKAMELELAADEILTNIMSYAYPGEPGAIALRCTSDEHGRFMAEIMDWGLPFDPLQVQEPDVAAPLEERSVGGLGLFLVQKMVDQVQYERQGDRNILRIFKKI